MGKRAVKTADPLATYNAKRDFAQTAEPAGEIGPDAGNIFMVQKHDATRLHWDFRLELDGVLKSWAVTRGPSLNPDDKRLAVQTEDHPMAYATFEGTIPAGQYGGGTVMLWDRGTWESIPGKDPRKTLVEGHLHFILHGERMKGEWLMIRLKRRPGEKRDNWLLRKIDDEFAGGSGDLVDRALTSVATGRTMTEIASGKGGAREWQSNKGDSVGSKEKAPSSPRGRGSITSEASDSHAPENRDSENRDSRLRGNDGAKKGKMPAFQSPQLATLVDHVPTGTNWLHEVKYDGYRTLIAVGGGKAKAFTRTGLDWSDRFAPIVEAAAATIGHPALIDGEVVALDAQGRPSFQALQASLKEGAGTLAYFAFDILSLDGKDLTGLSNLDRKAKLEGLLKGVPAPIHYSDHVVGHGEKLFDGMCREGLEGIISKRADAPYRVGLRTKTWLKIKCLHRQEFVIVGWTPSDKGRGFRSLLLGVHEGEKLIYAGKVGTGFGMDLIDDLMARMKPLERKTATVEAPRAAVRGAHWITPRLVAEIAFTEVTDEGLLRHPSFIGLREDKPQGDVVMETPAPVGAQPKKKTLTQSSPAKAEGGSGVVISNRDRVIFPESGITKGQLADYYEQLAVPILEWLADRPVSLVRCPQGRAKQCFFQKHDAGSFGDAVKHVPIREKDGSTEPYLYIDDAKGILTCVQMGGIEFHGWGSKIANVEMPDRLVFDLDPDEGLGFEEVKKAAFQLRDVLAEMGLATWPMLSGGKGVHVVAPLDASRDWVAVKDFANRFALAISEAHPDRFTANMKKVERKGRIFLDWLRNQRGATAVLPYTVRARPNAPVAAPIGWDELDGIDKASHFTIADAGELLKRAGSRALKGWGKAEQRLPAL
ncbi:DNA ligase D [Sphingomonas sp. MMS24-J13]|uniref:DNA ligase D n=1 Tax=Sphingomonas sp. MMS24-J13 TaxID=3238686 RepID=UPI00384F3E01